MTGAPKKTQLVRVARTYFTSTKEWANGFVSDLRWVMCRCCPKALWPLFFSGIQTSSFLDTRYFLGPPTAVLNFSTLLFNEELAVHIEQTL